MNTMVDSVRAAHGASSAGTPPCVSWFEECDAGSLALVGGKCASLGELIHAGVNVPPGFSVTTQGTTAFLQEAGIAGEIAALVTSADPADQAALDHVSERIRALIEAQPFPGWLEDEIAEAYRQLSLRCGVPGVPVAVRSSATAEDLPDASFAGQQDTYLWIRGVDEVLHHIRCCISSLYTGRAIAYRANRGFDDRDVAIAVGVQKMANSFTAGVMFTIHPANGDRSVIVIDSNYGFGESVVSGEVTPDQFVVNKITLDIIDRTISRKELCYTVDFKEQKSRAIEVPLERQTVQSLIDDEITELAWMGKKIEKHYGRPMDIEWAVDKDVPSGGNLFILQARPETVWSTRQKKAEGPRGSAMDYIVSGLLAGKRLS